MFHCSGILSLFFFFSYILILNCCFMVGMFDFVVLGLFCLNSVSGVFMRVVMIVVLSFLFFLVVDHAIIVYLIRLSFFAFVFCGFFVCCFGFGLFRHGRLWCLSFGGS